MNWLRRWWRATEGIRFIGLVLVAVFGFVLYLWWIV